MTPDYIVTHWTHELLDLMVTKMVDRKRRERDANQRSNNKSGEVSEVSDTELFKRMGKLVKVVKH